MEKIVNLKTECTQTAELMEYNPASSRRALFKIAALAVVTVIAWGFVGAGVARAAGDLRQVNEENFKISQEIDMNSIMALRYAKIKDYKRMDYHLFTGIDPITPAIDPGYHIIACETWTAMQKSRDPDVRLRGSSIRARHNSKGLGLKNTNMKNYADSLVKYYNKWELGNSEDLAQIEKGFLTAIFSTLGRDSAEVDWYMANNRTDGEREEYIQRLLPLIEEMKKGIDMSKPPVSRDPSHEFYKLLLIKEGSSKLIVHYIYTKQQEHNEKIKKTLKRKEYNFSDIYGILYIK